MFVSEGYKYTWGWFTWYKGTRVTSMPIEKPMISLLTTNMGILTEPVINTAPNIAATQAICIDLFRPKYSADHIL